MMIKSAVRRTLSLVLALELFCAPVAMAQAEDIFGDTSPEEALLEGDVQDLDAALQEALDPETEALLAEEEHPETPGGEVDDYQADLLATFGYFDRVYTTVGEELDKVYEGYPSRFDGFLNFELANSWIPNATPVRRDTATDPVTLPDPGRLPDMKFDGYYVYNNTDKMAPVGQESGWYVTSNIRNVVSTWRYSEIIGDPCRLPGPEVSFVPDTVYGTINCLTTDPNARRFLTVVGNWVESDIAQITKMQVVTANSSGAETTVTEAYTANIARKNLSELAGNVLSMDDYGATGTGRELWLRVPADQKKLSLEFEAYEPYFNYLRQFYPKLGDAVSPCPMDVEVSFGGESRKMSVSGEMTPAGVLKEDTYYLPTNSVSDPARSLWTVTDIPLEPADGSDDPFTTITITVTAPNGTAAQTYIFHVERVAPTTSKLGYGNTPFGMIDKDTSAVWSLKRTYTVDGETKYFAADFYPEDPSTLTGDALIQANKNYAKWRFERIRNFGDMEQELSYYPTVNGGSYYKDLYPNCWPAGRDYDCNSYAIVVYQDTAFEDPGVTFTDSEGRTVDFGLSAAGAYQTCVTRTIQLRTAGSLTVDLYGAGTGTARWYNGANGFATVKTDVPMTNAAGSDQVDLRGLNVAPGVYTMVYTFTDPVTGAVEVAERPLIILPVPGDVDMDGAVTAVDGLLLDENRAAWASSFDSVVRLAVGRVFDRDHNGRLEEADVTATFSGFQPSLVTASGSDYMYLPLPTGTGGGSRYTRHGWDELVGGSVSTNAGTLTLKYLGVETGARTSTGVTVGASGPWHADSTKGASLPVEGGSQDNVFWMGVYLEPGNMTGRVEDFTISLIYDKRYIEPAMVYSQLQLNEMGAVATVTDQVKWEYMLRYYNLRAGGVGDDLGDGTVQRSIWAAESGSARYDFTAATARERNYVTHYSKVISNLEKRYTQGAVLDATNLRELTFSIKANANNLCMPLKEGYVLVVPFELKFHPSGILEGSGDNKTARLVELGAGMQDFNLVTTTTPASALSGIANLFSSDPGQTTSAFSAQDSIFGNSTENLRVKLNYDAESGMVPMGRDYTTREILKNTLNDPEAEDMNARYAVKFEAVVDMGDMSMDASRLPPGLDYNPTTGIISGYPEEAGEYDFEVRGFYYRIIVTPRRVRYYAYSQSTYYGETEFRGMDPPVTGDINPVSGDEYRTYTFGYYVNDLADWEKTASLTGAGTELPGILNKYNYTGPTFVGSIKGMCERPEDFVSTTTDVGRYTILSRNGPAAKNYVFEYVYRSPTGQPTGQLTILPRLVRVDYLEVSAAHTGFQIFHDQGGSVKGGLVASTAPGADGQRDTIALILPIHADSDDRPLTEPAAVEGDTLTLTFQGRFLQNDADKASGGTGFILTHDKEPRQLEVSRIELSGKCASNYVLYVGNTGGSSTEPMRAEMCQVYGTVQRRGVERIEIRTLPAELRGATIRSGDGINSDGDLSIRIHKGSGTGATEEGDYQYFAAEALDLGLHYNWVSEAEYEVGRMTDSLVGSGRYLADGEGHREGDDMRPYGRVRNGVYDKTSAGSVFTPAQDGYRLCISVGKYSTGVEASYIKVYSDPIHVVPRELNVTPIAVTRFYGDENANFTYSYTVNNLTAADRKRIQTGFYNSPNAQVRGTMEELEWLLEEEARRYNEEYPDNDFVIQAPTFTARESLEPDAAEVTAATDYSATPYKLILSGGKSVDYTFSYTSGDRSRSFERGWANLTVDRRPVVVDVARRANFATLYADTKKLTVDWATLSDPKGNNLAPLSIIDDPDDPAADGVVLTLPNMQTGANSTKPTYFYNVEGTNMSMEVISLVSFSEESIQNNVAVIPEDRDKLYLEYDVTFIPDRTYYNTFTESYFNIDFFKDTDLNRADHGLQSEGVRKENIQVDGIRLVGEEADNYLLVFKTSYNAQWRTPAAVVNQAGNRPTGSGAYQVPSYHGETGTGTILLRPIKELTLTKLGLMDYTYGDLFTPNVAETGAPSGTPGLTLTVTYDDAYDNDKAHNTRDEEVVFKVSRAENNTVYTTFEDRGFTLGYAYDGQTAEDVFSTENGHEPQILPYRETMIPAIHNGAHLCVMGKRSASDPEVYSQVTNGTLKVGKKTLLLKAKDVHRFYGEPNETAANPFTYVVRAGDLAQRDLEAMIAAGNDPDQVLTSDILDIRNAETEISAANLRVLSGAASHEPIFSTAAVPGSPVGEGSWGTYPLTMSPNGEWGNYIITTQNANIYVYKRPVGDLSVTSSDQAPVYTIYNKVTTSSFDTQIGTVPMGATLATVNVDREGSGIVRASESSDGMDHVLPLTGDALYKAPGAAESTRDQLIFTVNVVFTGGTSITTSGDDGEPKATTTTVLRMVDTPTAQNYKFSSSNTAHASTGFVKLRSIRTINIVGKPKTEYTYGEGLDLSGLEVEIGYATQSGSNEASEWVTVKYMGEEQFKSYGLYVNYWDGDVLTNDLVGTVDLDHIDTDPINLSRKALVDTEKKARTGDHLTIAYDHELHNGQYFTSNRKRLIISAFQSGTGQVAVEPIILGSKDGNYYDGTTKTPIIVNPRQLTFTVSASDKTYDGTGKTTGTLTLTNIFYDTHVNKDTGVSTEIRDVVYVKVGANYESTSLDWTDAKFQPFLQNVLKPGGVANFTTGSYTPNGTAPLRQNGYTTWTANGYGNGYAYGTGYMDFTFINPNVHYADGTAHGLGPGEETYWSKDQAHNDVTDQWDHYNQVTQLPVEVTNIVLGGPDAANYTWDSSDSSRRTATEILVSDDQTATQRRGQGSAPYATIHKANRATIQELAGSGLELPFLWVDKHSNVVYMTFAQQLRDMANNNNINPSRLTELPAAYEGQPHFEDDYRDELHFEYALFYQDSDGLYHQWAGVDGKKDYQDTLFFGGETVQTPYPTGYIPNVDQLPKYDPKNENTIFKGQIYQWEDLDSGVATLYYPSWNLFEKTGEVSLTGFVEDGGFEIDLTAYPGYGSYDKGGNPIGRDNYWYLSLYTTDRTPLPRDTVMYPLVRLAETHNYNASGALTGDSSVTPELLQEAMEAWSAYAQDLTYRNALEAVSRQLFGTGDGSGAPGACDSMTREAMEASEAITSYDYNLGASGRWPEKGKEPTYENGGHGVKTYTERIDVVSASRLRSTPEAKDDKQYLVEILEAVWFTDTLVFPEQRYFEVAVYNRPTRYYGYFYDVDMSAQVRFTRDDYLDLQDLIENIKIRRRTESNTTVEEYITVNQDHTIRIYAQIVPNDSNKVRHIEFDEQEITAVLGDAPRQLTFTTRPEKPSNRQYKWSSSNPAVATVDETGVVTFRGPGTAIITIAADNGRKAECLVTVILPSDVPKDEPENYRLFNALYSGTFMEVDEYGNFRPRELMRRGELVQLLDMLCRPGQLWAEDTSVAYVDITKKERYAEAVRRMTAAGVITGVPGNAFEGEREVSRAEFATMMARLLELDVPDTRGQAHPFADAGEDESWAYAYIDAVAKAGVMNGAGEDLFCPERPITREEVAAVISRLLVLPLSLDRNDLVVPRDVTPANWSFEAILRAVNTADFPKPHEDSGEELM